MNRSAAVFLLLFIWIRVGAQTGPGSSGTLNAGDLYKQGVAAYERKDFSSAIRFFTQVLRLAPSDVETSNLRGMCFYRLKQYSLAIQDFDRTLQLDTGYQKNYFYRGSCKLALQDYPGAMEDFNRQVVLFPSDPYNFNNLGYVKNALGDYPGSIQALIQALIIKPDYGAAYLNKGIAEYNMEDYNSALIDLQKGLTFKADSGDCYFYLGEVLDRKSEPVEACRDLMHAKKLHQEKVQKIPSMACEKWLVAQRYYDSAMEKRKRRTILLPPICWSKPLRPGVEMPVSLLNWGKPGLTSKICQAPCWLLPKRSIWTPHRSKCIWPGLMSGIKCPITPGRSGI